MNAKKFETLMYALLKDASKYGFLEFLEEAGLTEADYDRIKKELETTYNIKLYL